MVSNCTSLPNGLKRGKGIITNLLCKAKKIVKNKDSREEDKWDRKRLRKRRRE